MAKFTFPHVYEFAIRKQILLPSATAYSRQVSILFYLTTTPVLFTDKLSFPLHYYTPDKFLIRHSGEEEVKFDGSVHIWVCHRTV